MSLSADLSAYVVKTRFQDLPGAATIAAKRSLLDAIGVTLAASGLSPECRPFIELAIASGGTPEATIIGFGNKLSAPLAALANGAMAHALDFEDAYDPAPCHPNAQMIPAALAIAEATGASGREVVAALAVGCDLVCRLGLSLTVSFDTFGWYPPPILGAYGAAAAAGKLLKLTPEQMLDAFSLVLCQATCSAELKYSPHSTIRAVRDAFAAQAGVLSALLAQRGVKGFDLPFEGKAGFFALYARGQYEPARITENLGSVFEGVNISYKAWPACRGTHSYIEAALALSKQHKLKAGRYQAHRPARQCLQLHVVRTGRAKAKAADRDRCQVQPALHGRYGAGSWRRRARPFPARGDGRRCGACACGPDQLHRRSIVRKDLSRCHARRAANRNDGRPPPRKKHRSPARPSEQPDG